MAIKLTELRQKVQNSFKTVDILKENLSSSIDIVESASDATLEKVTISNAPTNNLWIFNNENGENTFVSKGKKVENTLIYLDGINKKLYIIMIELKSTLNRDKLIHCKDKLQDTLSHISIYLLLNNHNKEYKDIELIPIGVVCFNNEAILTDSRTIRAESTLINNYTNYKNNNEDNFLVELNTVALGRQIIPTITIQNSSPNCYFGIDFIDDIIGKV